MNKIFKQFNAAVKDVSTNLEPRTLLATFSTATPDRVQEVIPPEEWRLTNFAKNPVILFAHDYRSKPVGKALWTKAAPEGLIGKIQFADTTEGKEIYYLYSEGFMNAFSVGFMAIQDQKNPKILRQCELLEVSCVPVPCNPEALAQRYIAGEVKISPALYAKIMPEIKIDNNPEIVINKPEETETHIHIRVRPPSAFEQNSFRTIDISAEKGIQAVIGHLIGETTTTVQKYIFDKSKGWTMATAQAWVDKNKKDFEETADGKIQVDIEIYKEMITALAMIKEGRVLSGKNRELIKQAIDTLTELYDASETEAPSKSAKKVDKIKKDVILISKGPEITADAIGNAIAEGIKTADIPGQIRGVIRHLQGKI
jgi:HK97 family phage prohead protease